MLGWKYRLCWGWDLGLAKSANVEHLWCCWVIWGMSVKFRPSLKICFRSWCGRQKTEFISVCFACSRFLVSYFCLLSCKGFALKQKIPKTKKSKKLSNNKICVSFAVHQHELVCSCTNVTASPSAEVFSSIWNYKCSTKSSHCIAE